MAKKSEEKKQAYSLFVFAGLSFREISSITGVSTTTLSKWNNDENWEAQKAAQKVTRENLIQQYYVMLSNINKDIQDKGGVPDAKDADKINKIQASIASLDKNYDLTSYYTVLSELVQFIQEDNAEHAKMLGYYMLEFIKQKAKKLK